jgi:ABC-type polysaccharide transport system, permease component
MRKKEKGTAIIKLKRNVQRDWQLAVLALLPVIYFIVFHYIPMYGVQIAFKDFRAAKGIWGSPWVGFKHFKRFFSSYQFWPLLKNTLSLSFLQILIGFPVPLILALLLNQVRNKKYKKFVQSVIYCPHFISIVVLTGMLYIFLSPRNGIVNIFLNKLGIESIFFLGEAKYFRMTFVISGIWQNAGWNAIIYLAALSSVSPDLYEAAEVDGANKWQRMLHVDIPRLIPTAVMMLILEMGKVMNIGFQKAYLMQNAQNMASSEIISTYIYKVGLIDAQYSYSAAINLFNNIINIILLVTVNKIAQKTTENSLW